MLVTPVHHQFLLYKACGKSQVQSGGGQSDQDGDAGAPGGGADQDPGGPEGGGGEAHRGESGAGAEVQRDHRQPQPGLHTRGPGRVPRRGGDKQQIEQTHTQYQE